MAVQTNLNFHQTFKPEVQYISSILSIADGETCYEIKDISNLTGIPNGKSSGKVEPHIMYATYMGLIDNRKEDGRYVLTQTSLGKVVSMEDPGLQEDLSILLCHSMMCRKLNGADVWATIFTSLLPKYRSGIKKDLLLKELETVYPGKINPKNLAPFYSSYEDMFGAIGILQVKDEILSVSSLQYNKEYVYLYAYVLWMLWNEQFADQEEISSVQFEMLKLGTIFGWNSEQEYKILECLSDAGIVRMNRQLMPYTILKLTSIDVLVSKLYSELC